MTDQPGELAGPVEYKGRHIVLTSRQHSDGTWVSEYAIEEPGKQQAKSSKGRADGSFPSREAAELAAVQHAKALIDLH